MTSTGPLVLSGFAAGVSVDGPIASVSARFNAAGGAGFADGAAATGASSEALISVTCGVEAAIAAGTGVSATCVLVLAGAGTAPDAWRVRISTGLDDRPSLLLCGRDPAAGCCGVVCGAVGAWSAVDAMVVGRLHSRRAAAMRKGSDWTGQASGRRWHDGGILPGRCRRCRGRGSEK